VRWGRGTGLLGLELVELGLRVGLEVEKVRSCEAKKSASGGGTSLEGTLGKRAFWEPDTGEGPRLRPQLLLIFNESGKNRGQYQGPARLKENKTLKLLCLDHVQSIVACIYCRTVQLTQENQ
jgi:hypothetical protein